jgi:hypothetical protein
MRRSPEQPPDPLPCAPTERQEAFLARNKINPDRPPDFYEASHVSGRFVRARRQMSPTVHQEQFLKDHGKWRHGMTRGEAFDRIGRILAGTDGPA